MKILQYSDYGSFGSFNQMCVQNVLSSAALFTESGRIFTFGANDWGQLGLGHTKPMTKPSCIKCEYIDTHFVSEFSANF